MFSLNNVVGGNLRYIRERYNMSQEKLAEEIGATQHSVSRWESGKTLMPSDFWYRCSRYFGVKMDFFATRLEDAHKGTMSVNDLRLYEA